MAYWVKKEKIYFFQYFNSLDKKTRTISRIVAFLFIFFIFLLISAYYYKVSFTEFHLNWIYTNSGHTWPEFYANFKKLVFNSFIWSSIIVIVIHFLDYFTKDKKPDLICNQCFKIKEYDNDLKCQCGGNFVRKDSMHSYVNEEEYKLNKTFGNKFEKIFIRGANYYKCQLELPEFIYCPGCLSKIKLNAIEKSERKYYCEKCRKEYDFNTPPDWFKDGKINDEFKFSPDFIFNGELSLQNYEVRDIERKFKSIEKFRDLDVLPNKIECPNCRKKLMLYQKELMERKFKCQYCFEELDLRNNKEKV